MTASTTLLILNLLATWFMVGLIWMVQIVHYPLFAKVRADSFVAYQSSHQRLTSFVVGPPMLLEAFTSILMCWYPPAGCGMLLILAGIALVLILWLSTASLQIPCHMKLEQGFDAAVHQKLVNSNWLRTVAWSTRGVLVTWMLVHFLQACEQ